MTKEEILDLIRKNFPNASEVLLNEIASKLNDYENHVFSKVHKQAFEGGKDLGYRLGRVDGAHEEKLNWLGWKAEYWRKAKNKSVYCSGSLIYIGLGHSKSKNTHLIRPPASSVYLPPISWNVFGGELF